MNHRYLDDDGDEQECGDEGRLCPECFAKEAAYWASYFGVRPGMSREERRDQLDRMNPRLATDEEMAEYRRQKDGDAP